VRVELELQHPAWTEFRIRANLPPVIAPAANRGSLRCNYRIDRELLRRSDPITFVTPPVESASQRTSWKFLPESRVNSTSDCESGNAVLMTHALDGRATNAPPLFHKPNVKVTPSPRGIPRCPSCHEPDAIEPLQQLDDVWHVRCLNCRCGFTFEVPPRPAAQERRRRADRRAVARSGRRATDLPCPLTCDGCGSPQVKGWIRTGETLWARCSDCGRVQRVGVDVLV